MLTVAIAAASGGCHTGRRTPSCPPSPCTRTGHCTDGDLGRTLRGQLRHFGLVVGLELGHLAPQHRDVGLGLPQQRLQLDVLLQIGHSCLSVVIQLQLIILTWLASSNFFLASLSCCSSLLIHWSTFWHNLGTAQ